jgi:hypothetical protein
MLGADAVADGDAAYLSGTGEVGGIVPQKRIPTPGVIAFPQPHGAARADVRAKPRAERPL